MANELRPYLGGSDAAAVVGLSPWKTPIALWQEKVAALAGQSQIETDKPVLARGRRWEPVAREMLLDALAEREISVTLANVNQRYSEAEHDWMRAEIDAELLLAGETLPWNCELKTVGPFAARKEWGDEETDQIPTHYAAQAQWGMMVTGRKVCVVGALFGADRLRPYIIERDDEVIAWLKDEAVRFWNEHVLINVAPAPATVSDLSLLYPREREAALVADPYLTQQVLRLRALEAKIKACEREYEEIEFDIKQAMGDQSHLIVGRESREAISWKVEPRDVLDQAGLKAAHKALVKEFTRKAEPRVFRLKNFSIEGVMP